MRIRDFAIEKALLAVGPTERIVFTRTHCVQKLCAFLPDTVFKLLSPSCVRCAHNKSILYDSIGDLFCYMLDWCDYNKMY